MDEHGCRKTNVNQVEKQIKAGVKSRGGAREKEREELLGRNEAGEERRDQP